MSNVEILIKLRDLHEELSGINDDMRSTEKVDDETIDALGQLVTDVGVLVDQARQMSAEATDVPERNQLLSRIQQFESDHPGVSRFLSQVTDVLGMIGI